MGSSPGNGARQRARRVGGGSGPSGMLMDGPVPAGCAARGSPDAEEQWCKARPSLAGHRPRLISLELRLAVVVNQPCQTSKVAGPGWVFDSWLSG